MEVKRYGKGGFMKGSIPHSKGKTKENYEPLRRAGETQRITKRKIFEKDIPKIIEMYRKDLCSIHKIARHFKVRNTKICNILKQNGVKIDLQSRRDCNGKNNGFYGKKHSQETKDKISKSSSRTLVQRVGEKKAKEIGRKIRERILGTSNSLKGKTYEEIHGVEKAKELKLKRRESTIKVMTGRKRTKKSRLKQSLTMKKKWKDEEYRRITIKHGLAGRYKKPTDYERRISELCMEEHLPFMYTGDGNFIVGTKNPDFVHKNKKIIIEVYCDFFKEAVFGSVKRYKKERKDYLESYGYKVIFIGEKIMESKNWKKLCLNKIKDRL